LVCITEEKLVHHPRSTTATVCFIRKRRKKQCWAPWMDEW